MTEKEQHEKYEGKELKEGDVSQYERWALDFFHQKEFVQEPILQMTLQLDITEAYRTYSEKYKDNPDASFTAYITWYLIQTQAAHPYFRYRKIDGTWYIFANLPVFMPVAIGGEARFGQILLENPVKMTLNEFFASYRKDIDRALLGEVFETLDEWTWANSHFVGNLPNLQFSGFQLHTPKDKSGRPFFYFGKRYTQEGKTMIPMLLAFDHSNLDPFVISSFMEDFQKRIDTDANA
ncbi:hypothetical protein FUAX_40180 (plasmid) [Fulvitalea axinellae]|uniref:Chloramphenicol acetyltransferase n=1 Tax=Fulvitalea axinellae TaxID=1182444 RepID=A0AAU9CHE6_9BACT|nr:hypothetical protein FUAX_40180 [Fulvitalea axinellae]